MVAPRTEVISCRLTTRELDLFKMICVRHNVTVQDMLHAVIIDVILDEEMNVRRREQEGCQAPGETGKAGGAAA